MTLNLSLLLPAASSGSHIISKHFVRVLSVLLCHSVLVWKIINVSCKKLLLLFSLTVFQSLYEFDVFVAFKFKVILS